MPQDAVLEIRCVRCGQLCFPFADKAYPCCSCDKTILDSDFATDDLPHHRLLEFSPDEDSEEGLFPSEKQNFP